MPVTAKLSREFYERFGDKVVNEMIDLFNRIDEASRGDLRAFNEQNALRFEARLDRFRSELDAKIDRFHTQLDARIDRVQAELNARIDKRYAELDAKIDKVQADLDAKIDRLGTRLEARIETSAAEIHTEVEKSLHSQTRWIIAMWVIVMGAVLPLWFR